MQHLTLLAVFSAEGSNTAKPRYERMKSGVTRCTSIMEVEAVAHNVEQMTRMMFLYIVYPLHTPHLNVVPSRILMIDNTQNE